MHFLHKTENMSLFSVWRLQREVLCMEGMNMSANKCLEFSKKMAVLRKLFCMELISTDEYILAKNKIMDSYHILEKDYFSAGRCVA